VWAGDDTAVVAVPPGSTVQLLAADAVVGGVDADLSLTTLADLGWKALAVNLSDIAAMGGRPGVALASVVGLGADGLEELYQGLLAAAEEYHCAVVGGDLSQGDGVVVSVAVTGWVEGRPVLRSGARPGDSVWVSGPLGAAAAGLRLLQGLGPAQARQARAGLAPVGRALVEAHARPRPALEAGAAARRCGATAMIDVSDGFATDVSRLADSSGVGLEIDDVPVAPGATFGEALAGGDDYVLIFTAGPGADVTGAFASAGVERPVKVGRCTGHAAIYHLAGETLPEGGWEHRF
jgi:thiamine-monophosphate kinase